MLLSKVISGGQTGADRAGLFVARKLSIPTGGWAPKGWRTEKGAEPALANLGLLEHRSENYQDRTKANIEDSTGTVILASNPNSPGTALTIELCKELNKPWILVNPFNIQEHNRISSFINIHNVKVLNVAGNRESKSPGIYKASVAILTKAFNFDID